MKDDACRARALLQEVAEEYRRVLKGNLVGIYEHGSLSFGCFRWSVSDIDFLVVVKRELKQEDKEKLIRILMERTERAPEKGFEMSVVLAEHVNPFQHPTPFELHFSNDHLSAARENLSEYCGRMHGKDRDLAAHCTVTRAKGRVVFGARIEDVFGEVPREDYLDSIRFDIENAKEDVAGNPVYVMLNLCRVLAAVQEGLVLSKAEGGRWALNALDGQWNGLIQEALAAYADGAELRSDPAARVKFAGYMLARIEEATKQTEV